MSNPVRILSMLALVALAIVAIPAPAVASSPAPTTAQQQPSPMVIELDPQLDGILEDWGGLDARVGLTACGSIEYPTDDRTLVVGGPGTPPECNQEWRAVTLSRPGDYGPLWNTLVFHAGGVDFVSTLMPFPATDGPGVPPFWIELHRSDELHGGAALPVEDIRALGSLTTYVDGAWCGSADLTSAETSFFVPVGAPGTAQACRELGAEIVLVDGAGHQFAVRPSVVGFTVSFVLDDLTLDPQGRGVPGPASAGNAGLARGEDVSHGVLWLLAALAIVLLARRLTRPARP